MAQETTVSYTARGGTISSDTWFPLPPVEFGKAQDAVVVTLSGVPAGTGYTGATGVATTTDGYGTGLTVDTTDSGGIVTAVAVNAGGTGYRIGDAITISGGNADAVVYVATVSY